MKPILLLLPLLCGGAFAQAACPQAPAPLLKETLTIYIPPEAPTNKVEPVPPRTTPTGQTGIELKNTFVEEFDKELELADSTGPVGCWAPHLDGGWNASGFFMGYTFPFKRRQPAASEQQYYVDKAYGDADKRVDPFSTTGGVLTIKAERTKPGSYNNFAGMGITSGLLSTHQMYAQQYGYFEMRAKVPAGPALLPAFWMLALDRSNAEIDVMEAPGSQEGMISQGIHWSGGAHSGRSTAVPDFHKAMHTYGVLWLADRIVFYIDRIAVSQIATRAEQKKPYYMMVNLALGGEWMQKWVEPSDNIFPVTMQVDRIVAYTPLNAPCVMGKDNHGVAVCY